MATATTIGCIGTSNRTAAIGVRLGSALSAKDVTQTALVAANLFLLLAAYYVLKTVREALILTEGGAEIKSYASAIQSVLVLAVLPVYGVASRKIDALGLARGVTVVFVLALMVFSILAAAGVHIGRLFFLWVGVFSLVIAQHWALLNELVPATQAKRVFWIGGLGTACGAWAGAWLASAWFSNLGPHRLMLAAAAMLLGCLLLLGRPRVLTVVPREAVHSGPNEAALRPAQLSHSRWKRYFWLIAVLTVLINVISSTGEYIFAKLVTIEANRIAAGGVDDQVLKQAFIGQFYAKFFVWANLAGVLMQLLCVPLILRRMSLPSALFILPAIALASYGVLAGAPLLLLAQIARVLESGVDHSIQNTARHALFIPARREMRYQAHTVIDTVCGRAGGLLHSLIIFCGNRLALDVAAYAAFNLVFTLAALLVVAALYFENRTSSIWNTEPGSLQQSERGGKS